MTLSRELPSYGVLDQKHLNEIDAARARCKFRLSRVTCIWHNRAETRKANVDHDISDHR